MPTATTLINGSQEVDSFTALTYIEPLFVKGFNGLTTPSLVVTVVTSLNIVRFRIDETTNESLSTPVGESLLTLPIANGTTLTAYSKSGGLIAFRINTNAAFTAFLASAAGTGTATVQENIVVTNTTNLLAYNYTNSVNRQSGASLMDASYLLPLNKRPLFDANVRGLIVFLSTGFSLGKTWVKQSKDASGNIMLAIATNSATGADTDFGDAVMIGKNTGTVALPTIVTPPMPYSNLPTHKYSFYANAYYSANTTTSPYPYLLVKSKDSASTIAFTVDVSNLNFAYTGKTVVEFDFGTPYLGMFKSVGVNGIFGLGGAISDQIIGGSMMVTPFKNITGVRVVTTGGLTSTDVKIKQSSRTVENSVVLQGTYPVLDNRNRIYLSISENNSLNAANMYGAEVDVTEAGTYILKSQMGGYVTVTTNRLLYNPYFNGFEQFAFNKIDSDIFPAVTPATVLTGAVGYRCFYLKNRHPTKTFTKILLWSDLNCNSISPATTNAQYMQFGLLDSGTRLGDGSDNVRVLATSGYRPPPSQEVLDIAAFSLKYKLSGFFVGDFNDVDVYAPPAQIMPSSADLRPYVLSIADQGVLGACTANAVTSCCEIILKANGINKELSRRFNYYESRDAEDGFQDTLPNRNDALGLGGGAYMKFAMDAAVLVGLPDEATWPYVVDDYNVKPSNAAYTQAATQKMDRSEQILLNPASPEFINHIKHALVEGYPVALGLGIAADFQTITGTFDQQFNNPYLGTNDTTRPTIGGHAVSIVGYSDDYASFIILNSWTTSWGDNGYALLPYEALNATGQSDYVDAYVVKRFMGMKVPAINVITPPDTAGVAIPTGVVFNFTNSESNAIEINNLQPNQCVPIWVKRVINQQSTVVKEDILSTLRMKVTY